MNLTIDNCYEDQAGAIWHYLLEKVEANDFASLQLCSIEHSVLRRFYMDGQFYWHTKTGKNLVREYLVCKDGDTWCATNPDFDNLQESPAGFGNTRVTAIRDLKAYEEAHCEN